MRTAVLGAGGWGTTLAMVLHENGHEVTLWEFFPKYAEILDKTRLNEKFLKGVRIPDGIRITHDLKKSVEGADMLVLAVPSHIMRILLKKLKKLGCGNKIFVSVAKGIEQKSLKTMSAVAAEILGKIKFAVLSGPSHAEEVARRTATSVVAASKDSKTAEAVQRAFFNNYLRVYSSRDVTGVELGGSLKNVIAIAAGILDGMGGGDNTKAALITRGLAEITRLGLAMGAVESTFFGLSGLGDLVVTCESKLSRNRKVGEMLGRGVKIKQILSGMDMVAEGVKTTLSVYRLAKKYRIEMPITEETYNVIYKGKSPRESIKDLMGRAMKSETEFLK